MTQKIKNIQVIPLVRRLNRAFQGSTYQIVSRNTLFVRVETEDGILGEAFGGDEDIYQAKVVAVAAVLSPKITDNEIVAIAQSRNVAAVKVAEQTGYDRVAEFWGKLRLGTAPRAFAILASSAIGWTVPISLFACITDTSAVSSVIAVSSESGLRRPV